MTMYFQNSQSGKTILAVILASGFFLLSAVGLADTTPTYDPRVCFYGDRNYEGRSICVRENGSHMPEWLNDQVSSIKLYDGAKVAVYEHERFRVYRGTYVSSIDAIRSDYEDTMSSYKVYLPRQKPRVCFYTDYYYQGDEECYDGIQDITTVTHDIYSSVRIEGDIFVEAYEHSNYAGYTWFIRHDHPVFDAFGTRDDNGDWDDTPGMNDSISSIKIRSYSNTPLACFYRDKDFRGQEHCYTARTPANRANEDYESLRLYGNTFVRVSDNDSVDAGWRLTIMHDIYRLDRLKDSIKAINLELRKTQDFVCLYEHPGYRGSAMCAESDGRFTYINNLDTGGLNNKMSSLFITGAARVHVWQKKPFYDPYWHHWIDRSIGDLDWTDDDGQGYGYHWNDEIESMKVEPYMLTDQAGATGSLQPPTLKKLKLQDGLSESAVFSNWPSTHNSFNSNTYRNKSFAGVNHNIALADQLFLGIRNIEFDLHNRGSTLRICHKPDCFAHSVTAARLIAEISNFLKGADPNDVIQIYIDLFLGDSDAVDSWRGQMNEGLHRWIYTRHDLYQDGLITTYPVSPSCVLLPPDLTKSQVLNAGARVIILYNSQCSQVETGATEIGFKLPPGQQDFKDPWAEYGSTQTGCGELNTVSTVSSSALGNTWKGELIEEEYWRRGVEKAHGPFNDRYWPQEIGKFIKCGGSTVSFDFMSIDDAAEGDLTDIYKYRLAGYIWAWPTLPPTDQGDKCVSSDEEGFSANDCNTAKRFACIKDDEWKITDHASEWSQGQDVCTAEFPGSRFAVPYSAYQQATLVYAAQSEQVWVNYQYLNGEWVLNTKPPLIANAGRDAVVDPLRDIVTLYGSSNYDDVTYSWEQVAGTSVVLTEEDTARPSFISPAWGERFQNLVFSLVVTGVNARRQTATAYVSIQVPPLPANRPPIANAGVAQTVEEGILVTLDASASTDPENDTLSYLWEQLSGLDVLPVGYFTANTARVTFTAPAPFSREEVLVFRVLVSAELAPGERLSSYGNKDTATVAITVIDRH